MNGSGFGSMSLRQKFSKEENAVFRTPKWNVLSRGLEASPGSWKAFVET
jgi:hypothetical protein